MTRYYVHYARTGSDQFSSRYRLHQHWLPSILRLSTGDQSAESLAELITTDWSAPTDDVSMWNSYHQPSARTAYQRCFPSAHPIQPGLIVNGRRLWLSTTVDDWVDDHGIVLYHAPYSKQLPSGPSSLAEITLCYQAGVCDWSRGHLDYLTWTPAGSAVRRYTEAGMLSSGLTMRDLWDYYLEPRLESFATEVLLPLLRTRSLDLEQIYACPSTSYLAIK